MDGHCFSCWIPVHGQCAPTQGFSKVLLRSNPNHPNGWRFTNENHPFTVRFPSLGLVQIPWRKNTEKTPNWSRKASQWIGFTKTICRTFGWKIIWRWAITEHQLARNICKKPMAPWHSSQAKNSPFHQLTSRDHLEIPPGDAKGPAMAR